MALANERRKRLRVDLHWTVQLTRKSNGIPIETRTENLSSDGFYFFSSEPFTPGERLGCLILLPSHDPVRTDDKVWLQCSIEVVRVETVSLRAEYGVACQIEDYRLVPATHATFPLEKCSPLEKFA